MSRPFEESRQGIPAWPLQVENPEGAITARVELLWRALDFPQGGVLALAVKLYDSPGRPAIFHHALPFGSPALQALRQSGRICLVYQHQGWLKDMEKPLPLDLTRLPSLRSGPQALAPYVEAYQRELPKQGSPEAAWDAIELSLRPPAAKAKGKDWVGLTVAILLTLAAAAAAYFYFFPK